MIRESKIKELLNNKVVALIDEELNRFGFKYQKSKRYFIHEEKGFNQIININTPYSPLYYNKRTEQLYLTFDISTQIEIPDYEKWYLDKFGEKSNFWFRTEIITSQIELIFSDFDNESFYEPTASQQFKRNVSLAFSKGHRDKDTISISDLLKQKIPIFVSNLTEKSNILSIYNTNTFPYHNIFLLVYGGYDEIANEQFELYYQHLLNEIENKLKISEAEASSFIEELNRFIKNTKKVSSLSFTNPYKRSIKILNSKNDKFEFSKRTNLNEMLRLDISQFEVKTVNINSLGDILLFTDSQKIIKLNSKGELVFEKEIETKKGFDKISWSGSIGIIRGTNNFHVNNYIITSDNQFLELLLPTHKQKKGKLQDPCIVDFVFWEVKDSYLIIYENDFLVYNKNGELEKSVNIGQKYGSRIIIEKELIVTQKRDIAINILNFDGETIGIYEYGNGNNSYEFSDNKEYLVCFGYSTKSQFYEPNNGKKGNLWAHPTFVKEYKETMYNDIDHLFCMSIAKFSPDHKYIVGGARHGKYVAWTLPKLERFELIPLDEMIELLEPLKTSWFSANESGDRITKAELVNLDGKVFLKNRGNDISNIIFFENGDTFITELGRGQFVLSWDRNFMNLKFYRIEGRLDYHSNKYLTQKTKNELIIYEHK